LAGSTLGGCKCGRDVAVEDEGRIDRPSIAELYPDVPRPKVDFPAHSQINDPSFNRFMKKTLEICQRGDYDGFRQLFGPAYEPTSKTKFDKVWRNVKNIEVRRIVQGPQETPHYYVFARVRLREPDRQQQKERDIWVMGYKRSGRWRLGVPSQDVIDQLRSLETAPASPAAA
jgi:hypothetical protein